MNSLAVVFSFSSALIDGSVPWFGPVGLLSPATPVVCVPVATGKDAGGALYFTCGCADCLVSCCNVAVFEVPFIGPALFLFGGGEIMVGKTGGAGQAPLQVA